MSDQTGEFTGMCQELLCDLFSIKKICTSPYHAQSTGLVEIVYQNDWQIGPRKKREIAVTPGISNHSNHSLQHYPIHGN